MPNSRIVLITGASRGIGRAIALRFAAEGDTVVVNYRANHAAAEDTLHRCRLTSPESIAYAADVSDPAEAAQLVQAVLDRFERIDVLVNNAGITRDGLVRGMSEEDFDAVIDTNLKGSFNCIRFASRQMMRKKYGRIINITSVSGVAGNAGQANYSASKAGLIGLTKSVAKELASRNITANAIAPGFVKTEMTDVLSDEVKEAAMKQIPLGRFAEPEDIANAAVFLASVMASYITGQVLLVDGGMVM